MNPNAVTPAGIAVIAPGFAAGAEAMATGLNADGFPSMPPIRPGIARVDVEGKATSGKATFTFAALETIRVEEGGGVIVAERFAVWTRCSNCLVLSPDTGGAALKLSFRLA